MAQRSRSIKRKLLSPQISQDIKASNRVNQFRLANHGGWLSSERVHIIGMWPCGDSLSCLSVQKDICAGNDLPHKNLNKWKRFWARPHLLLEAYLWVSRRFGIIPSWCKMEGSVTIERAFWVYLQTEGAAYHHCTAHVTRLVDNS